MAESGVATAATPTTAAEVTAASAPPGVTNTEAEENLAIQHRATRVDVVEQVKEDLGEQYAGVWFDNEAGEFVVPLATIGDGAAETRADKAEVATEFRSASLGDDYRTEAVESSRGELVAAQGALDEQLGPFFESASIQTALNPETNAIEVSVPEGLQGESLASIEKIIADAPVEVEIAQVAPRTLQAGPTGCNESQRKCALPVRGGEVMYGEPSWIGKYGETLDQICTVGFRANGNDGHKYLLTAGHCAFQEDNPSNPVKWNWKTQYEGAEYGLGTMSQFHYPGKDWAKIDATGSDADRAPWPTELAYWGGNQEYPIGGEAESFVGQTVCHVGANTGTSCGLVWKEHMTVEYWDGSVLTGMFKVVGGELALGGGDSGGPVVANNVAFGLTSGGNSANSGAILYFSPILAATTELNVNLVGRGAPEAITGGSEGVGTTQATVTGQVNPHGLATTYTVEYGQGSYSNSTSATSAGSGQGFTGVSVPLSGLQPLGRYQYRIKATNAYNTAYGAEGTFTTSSVKQIAVVPTKNSSWSGVMWTGTDGNVYETDAPANEWESYAPTWERRNLPAGVKAVSGPVMVPNAASGWSGILWTGSDGSIYDTQAPSNIWESWNLLWGRSGIPNGVSPIGEPTVVPYEGGWLGAVWDGSDGNIYWTHGEPNGTWATFSPTWGHKGIPSGVRPVSRPVYLFTGGFLWAGSDGNVYDTQANKAGEWEAWSPTWSHVGIPPGVRAVSAPAVWRNGSGAWAGVIWIGSDGNVYETYAKPNGEWASFSPTWNRIGIPAGVSALGDPVVLPSANGSAGIVWVGTDGNIYDTQAPASGEWESWSPTWSHSGIPSGVRPVADPVVIPNGQGWGGLLWPASDGNIYDTQAINSVWSSFSPTWSRRGIPAGVGFAR